MPVRRLLLIVAVALLLVEGHPRAQSCGGPCTIAQNTQYSVAADDFSGAIVTGYRLYNGTTLVTTLPVSALVGNTIVFNYPFGSPAGTYVYTISAYNAVGETKVVPAITLTITGTPTSGLVQIRGKGQIRGTATVR